MIWAFLGYLVYGLFSGADISSLQLAADAMQQRVAASVQDDERRASAEAVIEGFSKQLEVQGEVIEVSMGEFFTALRDPASSQARIETKLGDLTVQRKEVQNQIVDLRFALREHMTREEWALVFPEPDLRK